MAWSQPASEAAAPQPGVCASCGQECRPQYERCWDCFRREAGTCADCGGPCGPGREVCRRCYMARHELSECVRCRRLKPDRFELCYSCEYGPRPARSDDSDPDAEDYEDDGELTADDLAGELAGVGYGG